MALITAYQTVEPKRIEIDALPGPVVMEFGSPGCGWCRAADPRIVSALAGHPQVRHIRIADASGRRLGRSFGVKLWPTLVFLRDGKEAARLVRPGDAAEIAEALARIDAQKRCQWDSIRCLMCLGNIEGQCHED